MFLIITFIFYLQNICDYLMMYLAAPSPFERIAALESGQQERFRLCFNRRGMGMNGWRFKPWYHCLYAANVGFFSTLNIYMLNASLTDSAQLV